MIQGEVSDDGVPIIQLAIGDSIWPAIIDTGLNGDLELPDSLRHVLKTRFLCRARSLLAAGQIIEEDVFLIQFPLGDEIMEAEATFAIGNEILIGTHLLSRYRLEINFVDKSLMLSRVS
jgi:predicted aspartyl protease